MVMEQAWCLLTEWLQLAWLLQTAAKHICEVQGAWQDAADTLATHLLVTAAAAAALWCCWLARPTSAAQG